MFGHSILITASAKHLEFETHIQCIQSRQYLCLRHLRFNEHLTVSQITTKEIHSSLVDGTARLREQARFIYTANSQYIHITAPNITFSIVDAKAHQLACHAAKC
eukprot:1105143_1